MRPQQAQRHYHIGVTIERPAYYRAPRSRPVSFERPNSESSNPVWENRGKIEYHERDSIGHHCKESPMNASQMRLASLASHNSTPKPFTREQPVHREHFGRAEQFVELAPPTPKILINDQAPYPTSTVHKSMLNRRSPACESTELGCSRSTTLLSPTMLTSYPHTGLESVSPAHQASSMATITAHNSTSGRAYPEAGQQLIGVQASSGGAHLPVGQVQANRALEAKHLVGRSLQCLPRAPEYGHRMAARSQLSPGGNLANSNTINANTILPDDRRAEYMWNRQMERVSIAHQTYRTLPIIMPKPKARHDLASGTYMRYVQDPSWEFARLAKRRPIERSKDYEQKIQLAGVGAPDGPGGVGAHKQVYMDEMRTNANDEHSLPLMPAFNYREYIESTRRGY